MKSSGFISGSGHISIALHTAKFAVLVAGSQLVCGREDLLGSHKGNLSIRPSFYARALFLLH